MDEAVNLALEYNLALKKTEIDLAASGYSEKKLWMEIFPAISASANIGYDTKLFSEKSSNQGMRYGVGFAVALGLNAGIPYTMKSVKLAHQANILKYEDARNQLSIQVTKKFYALLAEKNNLLLLEEILSLAQRQYARSETLFRNGLVSELSLSRSSLALENARYDLSAAGIAHDTNMAEFLSMIGVSFDAEKIALSGEINIIKIEADAEALIAEYLPARPDIVRGKQEIERLDNERLKAARQSRAPSVRLSAEWGSRAFNPFSDTLSASASLSVPIDPWIPGTAGNQSIIKANNAVEKAALDLKETENAAKTQIRSLSASLRNLWNSIRIARLSLDAARRSYQLTEQGFQNGTVEALILEDARNEMSNARQRLLQTELSYFNMTLDLSAAINADWKNFTRAFGVTDE